ERIVLQQIIPTSRVKKVIEIAFEEARRLGTGYVGTEHLLLGLLIEGEGVAAKVLDDLGVTLEKARAEIARLIEEGAEEPAGAADFGKAEGLRAAEQTAREELERALYAWRKELELGAET